MAAEAFDRRPNIREIDRRQRIALVPPRPTEGGTVSPRPEQAIVTVGMPRILEVPVIQRSTPESQIIFSEGFIDTSSMLLSDIMPELTGSSRPRKISVDLFQR